MLINKKILLTFIFLIPAFLVFAQLSKDISLANEYYRNGELEKARVLYEQLIKKDANIALIHNNYFNLLLNSNDFDEATKYINRILKKDPDNIIYNVDKGRIFVRQNAKDKESAFFDDFINRIKENSTMIRIAAQYMINHQLTDYAAKAYLTGRMEAKNPFDFSLELANVYRVTNKTSQMIEEYLNFAHQNPANVRYVKNVLQNILTETEELEELEIYLIQKIQKNPNDNIYSELLIWANLQMKNFYGAFIQARAIDKRQNTNGSETMEVGMIALKNKEYATAIKIFEYIINNYNNSINYPMAKTYVIMAREEHIKNTYPVDTTEIRQLIYDYQSLISEVGINNTTLDALRNKALLHAFYLNEYDSAIDLLQRIIQVPRISSSLKAQCKIDLGDIYILTDQPWESTLLYSQVEKSMKETPVGYEAKLRNAKLNFYKGDFGLAQDHLDILKLATSREIANDAMQLSLLIQINSDMDTVMTALKKYAAVEMLLFRNRKLQALDSLNLLLEAYPSHNIADEVLLTMAEIQIELGQFNQALTSLANILDNFGQDILADDALFLQGKIYEDHLLDTNTAMQIYQDFLKEHPGSLYAAEARKRFRRLRGDFIN